MSVFNKKSLMVRSALLAFFCMALIQHPAHAQEDKIQPDTPSLSTSMEMSGYKLSDFGDFVHKWHFVTTRFRRDTGELRFVYANDLAWEVLKKGSINYPNGAAFAKVNTNSQEDPAFADSLIPSADNRVQVMVRNRDKYKDTDGWGYAIFRSQGQPILLKPEHETVEACNACHLAVKNRGMIFSQIPHFLGGPSIPNSQKSNVQFETVETASLPKGFSASLPQGVKQVRQMQSILTEHTFFGSMNESKMLMGIESLKSNLPVAFIGKHGNLAFAAVWPASGNDKNPDGTCHLPGEQSGKMITGIMISVEESAPIDQRYHAIGVAEFCAPLQ